MIFFPGVQNRILVGALLVSLAAVESGAQVLPTAVFLDSSGATNALTFSVSELSNAGGLLTDWGDGFATATSVASAQNAQGDVYIVGIDPFGGIWLNILRSATRTWAGWISGGAPFQAQSVDIAIAPDGTAWIVAGYGSIWLTSYTASTGFANWVSINPGVTTGGVGIGYSNAIVRVVPDGSIYVLAQYKSGGLEGGIANNGVAAGRYNSGNGFTLLGQRDYSSFRLVTFSATVGSDGALYVCSAVVNYISAGVTVSMSRISGTDWSADFTAPGQVTDLPRLAAGAGKIFAVALDPQHRVYVNEYAVGTGNGWQSWTYANGALETIAAASTGDTLYVAGFDRNDDLWWYQAGAGWTYVGQHGVASSFLTASPR